MKSIPSPSEAKWNWSRPIEGEGPVRRFILRLHNRTSLLQKVLIANSAIVIAGGILGAAFTTRALHGSEVGALTVVAVVLVGLGISVGVNYFLLLVAFQPLFSLRTIMERVRQGNYQARADALPGDPDVRELTETFNLMLDELEQHRQQVSSQIIEAMEKERKRIARELHDETSQALTSLVVNLEAMENRMVDLDPTMGERIRTTKELTHRTLGEIRRLMYDLRPSVLDDLGLLPAVRWFVKNRLQPAGIQCDYHPEGFEEERPPEVLETTLFRIVQEALTNVLKHSRATHVSVRLWREPGFVGARVIDDGRGFNLKEMDGRDERGLGLFGMQERAALLGGRLSIDTAKGAGTTVTVTLPWEE